VSEWFLVEQIPRRFRVRPARVGEVVRTPNGSALAEQGQYLIEGDDGDEWLLNFDTLDKYFRVVESADA
jgi:hypothetical protein